MAGNNANDILARWEAVCEAAPKEPWTVTVEDCDENGCERGEIFIDEIERSFHSCEWADPKDWDRDMAVAEFCAAARTGWPRAIRALRKMLERVQLAASACSAVPNPYEAFLAEIQAILEGRDA